MDVSPASPREATAGDGLSDRSVRGVAHSRSPAASATAGDGLSDRSDHRLRARVAGPSGQAPARELIDAGFSWEIADAPLLHAGLNLADLAHVLDLRDRGLVPEPAAAALLGVLLDAYHTEPEDFGYDASHGEVYNSRERRFTELIGDSAGWLHAGRPRREAARIALRLLLREQTARLIGSCADFASAAAATGAAAAATFMPDQTYLQQAQPSTFGHYLLAFVPPALRDGQRLRAALGQVDMSPGGAGCVNGSRLLRDRSVIADRLGFGGVIRHTRDAMWQTDVFVDLMSTSVSCVANQSKLAEDLEIWSSQEFDYVDLAGPFTRASVLMPQKRNPYSLSIVRGAGGVLIGRLSGFLAVVKSPSARSDNLIFAYGEIPRALDLAIRVGALSAAVVRTLSVNEARMRSELERGFSQATDLAEFVMTAAGVDYRTAYNIVGRAVRTASRGGMRGRDITSEMLDDAAESLCGRRLGLSAGELVEVLDPRSIVATRQAVGGAAPEEVKAMAARFSAEASRLRRAADAALARFEQAEQSLVAAAEELAAGI